MTKAQKKLFKGLKGNKNRTAYVEMLTHQQYGLGGYAHWHGAYDRKCEKTGSKNPARKLSKVG